MTWYVTPSLRQYVSDVAARNDGIAVAASLPRIAPQRIGGSYVPYGFPNDESGAARGQSAMLATGVPSVGTGTAADWGYARTARGR